MPFANPTCQAQAMDVMARMSRWLLAAVVYGASLVASAQTPSDQGPATNNPVLSTQSYDFSTSPVRLTSLPRNIFMDQEKFWTAPFHMNETQWQLAVPLVLAGGGLIASDLTIEQHVPTSLTTVKHASTFSNAGMAAMVGVGGGLFVWGHLKNNDQQRETGLLSGEAAIDAVIDTEIFKLAAGRDRPFAGDGQGRFFQGGSSFPSEHASASFAIASVIAHEYPGPLTQILVYGLAGGVSAARFAGQKHFASDVIIGGALCWYT
jgi:membrane-associated phospholipid phosphatase